MTTLGPAEAFPPGEFLRDELEERRWSPADLARMLDQPLAIVDDILAGTRSITPDTARGIAAAFGTTPELRMNLEAAYRSSRAQDDGGDASIRRPVAVHQAQVAGTIPRR